MGPANSLTAGVPQARPRGVGFQACGFADFPIGSADELGQRAGWETRDTAGWDTCATTELDAPALTADCRLTAGTNLD